MVGGLRFEFEPLDAPGVKDPTEASTWGRVMLEVQSPDGEHNLTQVWDRISRVERSAVYDTLMPLAEWLARCWHHIAEGRRQPPGPSASSRDRYRWERCHRLRYAGQGAALPDLCLWRSRDEYLWLEWKPDADSERYQRVRFTAHGKVEVPTAAIARSLDELLELVLGRLDECAPDDPRTLRLRAHWRRGRDESAPDFNLARLLGRIGVVLSDLTPQEQQQFATLADEHDPTMEGLIDLSAASADPDALREAVREVQAATSSAETEPTDLREIRSKLPPQGAGGGVPWEAGWRQAESLRSVLNCPHDSPWSPSEEWLPGDLALSALRLADDESLVAWTSGKRALRSTRTSSVGFRDVRDTWPILFMRNGAAGSLVLSSSLAGPTSIANAFATELLAPHRAIRDAIAGRDWIDLNDIQQIASDLKAPFLSVLHQVENRHIARVEKY